MQAEKNLESCKNQLTVLENEYSIVRTNLNETETKLNDANTNLFVSKNEIKTLQEKLQLQQSRSVELEKEISDLCQKVETFTCEKNKLSQNLDEYLNKVSFLENEIAFKENDIEIKDNRILELEMQLSDSSDETKQLQHQLNDLENDISTRIQESPIVKELNDTISHLNNEISEHKQVS